jgi:signal transduction histidine kinase
MDEREIAFIGKITAGVTHEVNNVFAIIQETAGLIGDILSIASRGCDIPHMDKIDKSMDSIRAQLCRGTDLISRLNGFAHTTDEYNAEVDLNKLMDQLFALCTRFARVRRVRLVYSLSETSILFHTRPVWFQMGMFTLIDLFIDAVGEGGVVTCAALVESEKIVIRFFFETGSPDPDFVDALPDMEGWVAGEKAIGDIGGTILCNNSDSSLSLVF